MIYFCDASGSITRCVPERLYQGSVEANTVILVAPYAENMQVDVSFLLPSGEKSGPHYLTYCGQLEGVFSEGGKAQNCWKAMLPFAVTATYGQVTVQFRCTNAAGQVLATERGMFVVEEGVPAVLPKEPTEDVYDQLLTKIAALYGDLHNSAFAARALYAYNEAFTYASNEIAFCPEAYEHGSFVRSKVSYNEQSPYDETGNLNAQAWEEVCRFDDVFEQAALAQAAQENAQSCAAAAQESKDAIIEDVAAVLQMKEVCEESADAAAQASLMAQNFAQAAQESAEHAVAVTGGDYASYQDYEKIKSGEIQVGNALQAVTAQKALQDQSGNPIAGTYATKTEFQKAVLYDAQTLSSAQKQQAIQNIGAWGNDDNIVVGHAVSPVEANKTYIQCSVSGSCSSGKYYFINCAGSISITSNEAKVYITDSPELVVNGITEDNWFNIYQNGTAEYVISNTDYLITNETEKNSVIIESPVAPKTGDHIIVSGDAGTALSSWYGFCFEREVTHDQPQTSDPWFLFTLYQRCVHETNSAPALPSKYSFKIDVATGNLCSWTIDQQENNASAEMQLLIRKYTIRRYL